MTPRIIAIDWSGAAEKPQSKIWLAEAADGEIVRLESGRSRDGIAEHLITESHRTPDMIVGLDFAFGLPQWFLEERGLTSGPELWDMVATHGESWLAECTHPFWGRPGRGKPALPDDLRKTDREAPAIGGIRPKSVFQIGGAGAVGTGSLRGMPVLKRLRDGGFAIWPFDEARGPVVIEIYPRVLTGAVNKGDPASRDEFLERNYPNLEPWALQKAASSEDAFDAAVSALVMEASIDELSALRVPNDVQLRREGLIWAPRHAVVRSTPTAPTRMKPPKSAVYRQFDSSRTRVAPVFGRLLQQAQPDWIVQLLDLAAANGPAGAQRWREKDLTLHKHFWGASEKGLQPPVSLLSWLIRNAPHAGKPEPVSENDDEVAAERHKLWRSDAITIERGLKLLRNSRSKNGKRERWHILEGATCPDAYLVTKEALIVVEGKRTEAGPTTDTTWMRGRHQMLRHLDAAWEIRGSRAVFGLFIVDAGPAAHATDVPRVWKDAAIATTSPDAIARSLPHRGLEEREEIREAFVGVTTWQAVVAHFGLDHALALPDDVTKLQEA